MPTLRRIRLDVLAMLLALPMSVSAQVGIANYFPSGSEVADAIGVRYRVRYQTNAGSVNDFPKIKLILGTHRLYRPGSATTYIIETNSYTSRWTYSDPTCFAACTAGGCGIAGTETYDQASLRPAIPDYVGLGRVGAKTFSASMFPRQTYQIDFTGPVKTDLMAQANLNQKEAQVILVRGPVITDKTGWKCSGSLDSATYREWDAAVIIDGVTHLMAFAVPDADARYLIPGEIASFTSEFFANPGAFAVYVWDIGILPESDQRWRNVRQWQVFRVDTPAPTTYGARVAASAGHSVIEISNTAGSGAYLPLGTVFDVPSCGDGVVDTATEQCDDGPANGSPGACPTSCLPPVPSLRIPVGSGSAECASEWSVRLGTVNINSSGLPASTQSCVDNDPACDLDPNVGSCRFRVWECFGGADSRIGCSAIGVQSASVLRPPTNSTGYKLAARTSMISALAAVPFPVGPGEVCTQAVEVDVPTSKTLELRTEASKVGGGQDTDDLNLDCDS
jgi:hypothetical protein